MISGTPSDKFPVKQINQNADIVPFSIGLHISQVAYNDFIPVPAAELPSKKIRHIAFIAAFEAFRLES